MDELSVEKCDTSNFLALLKIARKIKNSDDGEIRIAVLASYSIQHFVSVLRLLLYQEGITANIYEGEYNAIKMEVLDQNSELYMFKPNVVILLPYHTDIKAFPDLLEDRERVYEYVNDVVCDYKNLWDKMSSIENCHILQGNFVSPIERQLGNLENNYIFSGKSFYQLINIELIEQKKDNVTIVDIDTLACNLGKYSWFDYSAYFLNKAGFSLQYVGYIADLFVRQIKAIQGKIRKCLVLDLDNTLWGGTVGDLGYENIQLDPNHAVGEAYQFFQSYIIALKNRGVILAICSKNEEDIAKLPFLKNENMLLKLEDISCFVANWEDKASNLHRIAKELNIGIDSLVFFDDNPAEREIVKTYLPEVLVIDVPEDPAEYALALEKASPFEWLQLTKEDLDRSESYYENHKRMEMASSFVNYDEYLQALNMFGHVGRVEDKHIERFTQLINKSNQFNLRTQRYQESFVKSMCQNDSYRCLFVKLKDKFSDYGIISCIILKKEDNTCFIDSWVMSCRVLKRGVELFAFEKVIEYAKELGCDKIVGEYIPTKKNAIVKNFYKTMGFVEMDNGNALDEKQEKLCQYVYEISEKKLQDTFIREELMERN